MRVLVGENELLAFSVMPPESMDNSKKGIEFGLEAVFQGLKIAGGRRRGDLFLALGV